MGDAPRAPLFFGQFEISEPRQDSAPAEGDSHATFLWTAVTGFFETRWRERRARALGLR